MVNEGLGFDVLRLTSREFERKQSKEASLEGGVVDHDR